MYSPARIAICLSISAALATPVTGLAASATGYLSWSNKAPQSSAPVEEVHTPTGSYPVPASPYGQVGDPYARALRWPTKQAQTPEPPVQVASQMPIPVRTPVQVAPHAVYQPVPQPVPQAPTRVAPPVSAPVEMRQPQPPRVVAVPNPVPNPIAVPQPEDPGLADDPDLNDAAPVALSPRPEAAPKRPATTHAEQMAVSRPLPSPEAKPQTTTKARPVVAPIKAPVVATAPAPTVEPAPAYRDGGYQVPATSKYAARIAASRASQDAEAAKAEQLAAVTKPEAKPDKPVKGQKTEAAKDQPTPPAPTPSLASEETDHVFIPGERALDITDEPRFYSLHRQYGLKPDPITVDHNATGALLELNGVDAIEGGDPNADTDTTDSSSKKP